MEATRCICIYVHACDEEFDRWGQYEYQYSHLIRHFPLLEGHGIPLHAWFSCSECNGNNESYHEIPDKEECHRGKETENEAASKSPPTSKICFWFYSKIHDDCAIIFCIGRLGASNRRWIVIGDG